MSTVSQRSFSGGEIAPSLAARVDFNKYQTSVSKMRNFISQSHGGASNRPGTEFVAEVKDSTKNVRLIPFDAGSGSAYCLELGDFYIRFHKNGTQVRTTAQNITNITTGLPCVVTYDGADNFVDGDEVYLSGTVGGIGDFLNNRSFKILNVNTIANTFQLLYMDGSNVNSTTFGAYSSAGSIEKTYEVVSPYSESELYDIQYAQSVDVVTLVHPSHQPRNLSRISDTSWTISNNSFNSDVVAPTALRVKDFITVGTSYTIKYVVTAVRKSDRRESLPGIATNTVAIPGYSIAPTPVAVISITQSTAPLVTFAPASALFPSIQPDNLILISGGSGMDEIKDRRYYAKGSGSVFTTTIEGEDSTNFSAYASGATLFACHVAAFTGAAPSSTNYSIVEWDYADNDVKEFNVYRSLGDGDVYGLIGITTAKSFKDIGIDADYSIKPLIDNNLFKTGGNYPSVVSYAQQRLFYAGTNNEKESVFASRISDYGSFQSSSPTKDDDSITFKAANKKFNPIRHIVELSKVVIFTESSELALNADGSAVSPNNLNISTQSYNGSSKVPPIVINESALYIQARGSAVRDLLFSFNIDGFSGNNISILADHLLDGYTITDWCFAQIPNYNVWAVRSDGILLGLTYLKEQQILAWHQHDFDEGLVETVCSIPGSSIDDVYAVVKRTIDGTDVKYVEKFSNRFVNTRKPISVRTIDSLFQITNYTRYYNAVSENKFLDSCLSFDGRNTVVTKFVKLTSTGGWTTDDTVTLTSNTPSTFSASDVGNHYFIYSEDSTLYRFEITVFTSGTIVSVKPLRNVPTELQNLFTSHYARAVDTLKGLWHLEGKEVSVFADSFVKASPKNPGYTILTVTNGQITLDGKHSIIHVGLPYVSDIKTLSIDGPDTETTIDKKMIIQELNMNVEKTRGLWVGREEPNESVSFIDGLTEIKARDNEPYTDPIDLSSDPVSVVIDSNYNTSGRVFIRQIDPIPANILSIHPSGMMPFRRG